MTFDVFAFSILVSWAATGAGAALWLWGLFFEKNPLRRLRFSDCGAVLVFSSVILRIVGNDRPLTAVEWALAFLSPLFIAAALLRLFRTACPSPETD